LHNIAVDENVVQDNNTTYVMLKRRIRRGWPAMRMKPPPKMVFLACNDRIKSGIIRDNRP
jgi:hypothetical protein